jgi:hypothetical protein
MISSESSSGISQTKIISHWPGTFWRSSESRERATVARHLRMGITTLTQGIGLPLLSLEESGVGMDCGFYAGQRVNANFRK